MGLPFFLFGDGGTLRFFALSSEFLRVFFLWIFAQWASNFFLFGDGGTLRCFLRFFPLWIFAQWASLFSFW